jgi:homoserine kinase
VTVAPLSHHTVQVPATTANLGPGFDSFGLALALHLAARTVPRVAGTDRVLTRGLGADSVSAADDNLVWRSFVAACEHFDVPVPDINLEVTNRIPMERGLGSSSAAIVAGIVLARVVTEHQVGEPALVELAAGLEGHPDNVAPAMLGGLVACAQDDAGRLVIRRSNPRGGLRALAFIPEARQATAASRTVLPEALARADVAAQAARAGHVLVGLTGTWQVDPLLAGDRLHEPVRAPEGSPNRVLLDTLREGGLHSWLSGSGPTVIALAPYEDASVAALVTDAAAVRGATPIPLELDLLGALPCPDGGCGISGAGGCVQCPRERLTWAPPVPTASS